MTWRKGCRPVVVHAAIPTRAARRAVQAYLSTAEGYEVYKRMIYDTEGPRVSLQWDEAAVRTKAIVDVRNMLQRVTVTAKNAEGDAQGDAQGDESGASRRAEALVDAWMAKAKIQPAAPLAWFKVVHVRELGAPNKSCRSYRATYTPVTAPEPYQIRRGIFRVLSVQYIPRNRASQPELVPSVSPAATERPTV